MLDVAVRMISFGSSHDKLQWRPARQDGWAPGPGQLTLWPTGPRSAYFRRYRRDVRHDLGNTSRRPQGACLQAEMLALIGGVWR